MEKKYSRILKKNNNSDYILNSLIKKDIKQNGGNDSVTLKKTQGGLLKALKSLTDIKIEPNSFLQNSLDSLNKGLFKIKTNLGYTDNYKKDNADYTKFTNNLNNFDKFLNDISGGEIKLQYKNDYKMNPLLKVNLKSLEEINMLFNEIADFKVREE